MTITYTSEVATCRGISSFLKLLLRWKGSIYKIVWVDLLMFLGIYYIISFSYRFLPDSPQKENYRKIILYCNKYLNLIPLSFVLGFYVNLVMTRWWSQYSTIPFPDNLAILVGASVKGQDEKAKIIRRTIMRYVCATFTITLTMLSAKVKKRFPTLYHFIDAGLLTKDEAKIIDELDEEFPSYSKYWLPLAWASNVVTRAKHEGLIRDNESLNTILIELNSFRSKCGGMLDYDWISIPLVYTQVVTIAVYSYFLVEAIGKQYVENSEEKIDVYFPFLPVLEFFFYMGWLKVAETLINPYGDDDDDFEVVWMVDRHLQVSYLLVDKIHEQHPKLMRDQHWFEVAPNSLPFTVASQNYMTEYPFPSTLNLKLSKADQELIIADDQTDHTTAKSFIHKWKRYGHAKKRKGTQQNMPLRRVTVTSVDNAEENTEEECFQMKQFEESGPMDTTDSKLVEVDCEEFEKLKQERIEKRQQQMLQYMELLNKNKTV